MTDPFAVPGNAAVPLPARLWPVPEREPSGTLGQLLSVLAIGLLGGLTLHVEAFGLAAPITGTAVLGVALWHCRTRPSTEQLVTAAGALLLLVVAAVRSADWLVTLCIMGAWALATLALVGGRTWTGVVVGAAAAGLVPLRAARWFLIPLRSMPLPYATARRVLVIGGMSAGLLLVFGLLFGAADPAYANLLGDLVPTWHAPTAVQRVVLTSGTLGVTAVAVYLAQRPPAVDALAPAAARPVRTAEWLVPLALVDALFASFVVVQLTVLFGDRSHVLKTTGLTYAEYARRGFWQLLVVTGLTLVVIAAAVRYASRSTPRDRLLVRLLLGTLCFLFMVIVASALHRMSLYQHEYGWTRLRLFVSAVELSLGAVFVLLLIAGIRLNGRFLPRAVVGMAAMTLLGLAAMNPDAWIARHDVDRFRATGQIDTHYLSGLSADAVPVLLSLPARERDCAVLPIAARLESLPSPWYDDNVARHRARDLLASQRFTSCS